MRSRVMRPATLRHQSVTALASAALVLAAAGIGAAMAGRPLPRSAPREAASLAKNTHPAEAALESGRGRHAPSPLAISLAGWRDIFWRTVEEVGADRVLAVAGGVVFFALMAVFPAVAALVSLTGLFADRAAIAGDIGQLVGVLPDGLRTLILDEVDRHLAKEDAALGVTLAIGLGLALWSANAGTKAVIEALNVAYGEVEARSFIRLNLVSLAMTVAALAATLLALFLVVEVPRAMEAFGTSAMDGLLPALRWPLMAILATGVFALLYRYAPSRRPPQWRWVWVGAFIAALLWLAGSGLFSLYLSRFSDFDATYGALGGVIAGMLWMWVSVIALLIGAELNAEAERQTLQDTTDGAPRPIGTRRAMAADTVGATP